MSKNISELNNIIIVGVLILISIVLCIIYITKQKETKKIEFSHKSGFYSDEFDLTIKGNGDIYYTFDGSIPTENSIKYTGPIHISDASKNPNAISIRDDFSICNNKQLAKDLTIEPNCKRKRKPKFNIDKCTIIRAVSISPNKTKSEVKSASYFINYDKKYGYDNINVISIITDPKNLFDSEYGIYVNGKKFDDYIRQTNLRQIDINKLERMLNYNQRGRQYERPAYIAFFNQDKKLISEQDIGIRVRGGISRLFPKKSFNIYARNDYSYKNCFQRNILNTNYSPKKLTLFSGSQDYINLKDYIIHSLLENNKNISTLKFKPYVLFLNGEYWGFYWLTEAYDKYYISHYFNINDISRIVEIKDETIEIGNNDDLEEYNKTIQFILGLDLTKNDNYEQVKKIIDIDSLINIYSVNIYTNNIDFSYNHNFFVWKDKLKNKKWQLLLYDLNTSNLKDDDEIPFNRIKQDKLFINLMSNTEFRYKLAEKLIKLSLNEFDAKQVIRFIEQNQDIFQMARIKDTELYYGGNRNRLLILDINDLEKIKLFYVNRSQKIYEQYCKELDYSKVTDKQVKQVCMDYR